MQRKTIPKKTRLIVYQKYDGHCAYCGCKLEYKDMQVDHVEPVYTNDYKRLRGESYLSDKEINNVANFMPSCRQCNFYKGTWKLEDFRKNLTNMMLNKLHDTFNYKLGVKYGIIKEDLTPVVFYFEKVEKGDKEQ